MPSSKSSYALLMAMCALTSQRIKNGVAPAEPDIVRQLQPSVYLAEAKASIDLGLALPKNTEELQAMALLCLTGQEMGDAALLQQYLGLYHATNAIQSISDETRWPPMTPLEREQRRRLYWWMYRLEVHMAMIMGHAVRCPELQSLVAYPERPDHDCQSSGRRGARHDDGANESDSDTEWLTGWNFVTDIYRSLEHLLTKFRLWRLPTYQGRARSTIQTDFLLDFDPEVQILAPLQSALENLPLRFRHAQPLSADIAMNRCGFQAANIVCTYQASAASLRNYCDVFARET